MAVSSRKPRVRNATFCRWVTITLFSVVLLVLSLRSSNFIDSTGGQSPDTTNETLESTHNYTLLSGERNLNLPPQNQLSISLDKHNQLPPRNLDSYPNLPDNHIVIVLYVHNRPHYLKLVVESLSRVEGINETLLVISHDGWFPEMNLIVESIRFCRVKQIFAPFSPHLFKNTFPGTSPNDCKEKNNPSIEKCIGNPDQYGNHRSPKIVSLKHHWWWMMNTVWDGLKETSHHKGHILFIEEDHFIYPNAYRNLQLLIEMKPKKCPLCYAANLAPYDVKSRGEGGARLIAEKMGNVGYSFNRTVWKKIHKKAREFCMFDDYNWDITMWATVYPSFGGPVYSLRGPRSSATHFGKCGLHQGQGESAACIDNGGLNIEVEGVDRVPNVNSEWGLLVYETQSGYQAGFKGWGGWGDTRDREMCMEFGKMYWT